MKKTFLISFKMAIVFFIFILTTLISAQTDVPNPISLKDIEINTENYVGDCFGELDITDIQPATISDFYGNTEDGYSIYIQDDYAFTKPFYIRQLDYNIFFPLAGQRRQFNITGSYGPYMESHIQGMPYRIGVKVNNTYDGMWLVYIELSDIPAPTPISYLLGDINSDLSVNIVDALMLAQYYVGICDCVNDPVTADVNLDGAVNIVDALLIAQYYVGIINSLPPV